MINTKDFLKSDKASEFDVSFTNKEWVAIKTWMKEYANEQLLLHNVSQQRELLNALADNFNESTHTYVGQPMIEETLKAFNCG